MLYVYIARGGKMPEITSLQDQIAELRKLANAAAAENIDISFQNASATSSYIEKMSPGMTYRLLEVIQYMLHFYKPSNSFSPAANEERMAQILQGEV